MSAATGAGGEPGPLTDMTYSVDAVHLSQRAIPLAMRRLREALGDLAQKGMPC